MKKRRLHLITFITVILVSGCTGGHPFWQIFDRYSFPREEVTAGLDVILEDSIRTRLGYLASQKLRGRETTYPGQHAAADYLARYFGDLNFTAIDSNGDYLQPIPTRRIFVGDSQQLRADLPKRSITLRKTLDFTLLPGSVLQDTVISDSVVFLGYGIQSDKPDYDEYAGTDIEGKWVLVIDGEPQLADTSSVFNGADRSRWSSIRRKRSHLKGADAAGVLVIRNPLESRSDSDTSLFPQPIQKYLPRIKKPEIVLRNQPVSDRIPTIYLSAAVADSMLASAGMSLQVIQASIDSILQPHSMQLPVTLSAHLTVKYEDVQAENVIAVLPGSDPDLRKEYVVLSAHYDHVGTLNDSVIFYGADDNASGTAAVLTAAEALRKNGRPPARSVLFLLVSGEEKGLLGSRYFTEHPLVPMENIFANINTDMIGRNAEDSIYVIGSTMLSQDLDQICRHAARHVPEIHLDYKYNSKDDPHRFYYRSDHYNFARHQIPVIFYFSGVHEDYHRPTDTTDKINYRKATNVTKLLFLTTWGVADFQGVLRQNGVLTES